MNLPLHFSRASRRLAAALCAGALASALVGCGGGSQAVPFEPNRMFAVGDDYSALSADGRKYAVNALKTDGTLDCAKNPLWTQTVASAFGLTLQECNPNAVASPAGQTLAQPGAQVAFDDGRTANTLAAQIDPIVAGGTLNDKDVVTFLIGSNDVLEQYAKYPATPEGTLLDTLKARGRLAGGQINRLALLGPAVLAATVPDLGLSPFGRAEKAAHTDVDRAALLTRLVDAFNSGLRLEMINDGRLIGVVFADQEVRDMNLAPGAYGVTNVSDAVCLPSAPLPGCTTATLVTGGNEGLYVWADGWRFSAGAQARLGLLAELRARNNPF